MGIIVKSAGSFTLGETRNNAGNSLEEKIEDFLLEKKILNSKEKLHSFEEIFDWTRSGGETYIAAAEIIYGKKDEAKKRKFIAKAIVTLFPEQMSKNMARRCQVLEQHGISVPKLYSISKGVIYQEFIDQDLRKIYPLLSSAEQESVIRQLAITAAILDKLGFLPLDFISDMRYQGRMIYYVDFGCDLGEPNTVSGKSDRAKKTLLEFIFNSKYIFLAEQIYQQEI